MKIMTILGTRPEIIRLSRIIPQLDGLCDHVLIHTGQNFDASLSDVFFQQLGVRNPDRYLGIRGETFGEQIGKIITQTERAMTEEQPDRVLEEVNRRIVDHCSDVLMPYTERSRMNLLREGIEGQRVFVTGNPIAEV